MGIDFTGQAAIVTGAGRGLGRLYALELARRGARVVVNDLGGSMVGEGSDPTVADQVVEEIRAAGGTAVASAQSVDSPEGGAAIVQVALDAFGRLDAVVSNAGITEMVAYDELTVEQWRLMRSVHLDGAFYLTQPAFRVMRQQGYGRLVFIASNFAAFGQPKSAHYAAAKGGIMGLTHALALEGAPYGILANSILPIAQTRMVGAGGDRPPNRVVDTLFTETTAERVVALAVYLASRECAVTHRHFSAAAGRYARVFFGLGEGWLADRAVDPTPEDVAAHIGEMDATDAFTVPEQVADEIGGLITRLGIA